MLNKKLILSVALSIAGNGCGGALPNLTADKINLSAYLPECRPDFEKQFACRKLEDNKVCSYHNRFGKEYKIFTFVEDGKVSALKHLVIKSSNEIELIMTLKDVSKDGLVDVISKSRTFPADSYQGRHASEEKADFMIVRYNLLDEDGIKLFNKYYYNGSYLYEFPKNYELKEVKLMFEKSEKRLDDISKEAYGSCGSFWQSAVEFHGILR